MGDKEESWVRMELKQTVRRLKLLQQDCTRKSHLIRSIEGESKIHFQTTHKIIVKDLQ